MYGRPYRYPPGYGYHRYSPGYILPSIILGTVIGYTAYASLGLNAPVAGTRWVQYGPDLLLIDDRDNRVIDARYGVFAP